MKNSVNYDEISHIYDDVRHGDVRAIKHFLEEVTVFPEIRILDIGCGTGNNTDLVQKITHGQVFGLEPSEGMIRKAIKKNDEIIFVSGHGGDIPFENDFFDFVYMTNVIHFIDDIDRLFGEIQRVLAQGAKCCIMTQSHRQIENRSTAQFFPSTTKIDKARYPDIEEIITTGKRQDLKWVKNTVLQEGEEVVFWTEFLEVIRKKGYSMLRLISEGEYQAGLKRLEDAMNAGQVLARDSGLTMVWFAKK
ncbi:MAG: methyltransferase domain-containing protein [Anaerolineaceae bacterium]|nr:methyltransferase domain-containing protein [Anaerolineaceae bacterium]